MRQIAMFAASATLLFACGGAPSTVDATTTPTDAGTDAPAPPPPAGSIVEHGQFIEYFALTPLAGLTVTDNGVSTTTDAHGKWSLTLPAGTTLKPEVTGTKFIKLYFPDSQPSAGTTTVDYGTTVMADTSSYHLEQLELDAFDGTKALVHIVMFASGACANAVGGTLKLTSPSGSLVYFNGTSGFPDSTVPSIQDVKPNRPVAVVYNVNPGDPVAVELTHPTCKIAAFPSTFDTRTYSGRVRTVGAEPGDVNSALVLVVE
jgi:hypothetical protein